MSAHDPSILAHPVVLFDGVCPLCSSAVRFIVRRDPHARFLFAPLQSHQAKALLHASGAEESLPDSIVLIDGGVVHTRSSAAWRIARRMRFPWFLLAAFWIVPRPLRDWMYDGIAARRYRCFGRLDACMTPAPELQARFLA